MTPPVDTLENYYNRLVLSTPTIQFRIDERPVPKGRPRLAGRRAYTPKQTREYEAKIRASATAQRIPLVDFPVMVNMVFHVVPSQTILKDKVLREAAFSNLIVPSVGDLDNLMKSTLDGLIGVAFYDDQQVSKTLSRKEYAIKDGITVIIQRSGLSELEIQRFKKTKLLNKSGQHHVIADTDNSRSSVTVGKARSARLSLRTK